MQHDERIAATSSFRTRPVVAGMATMPSRLHTFPAAFASIIHQIDRLYLYLDGHAEIPAPAQGDPRVTCIFSTAAPGLHGNGKFLGLLLERTDCLYLGVDDDIAYPPDYVARLREGLAAYAGRAVVGYHCCMLARPFVSYRQSRRVRTFDQRLAATRFVDVLGSGTVMFDTRALRFDVRQWNEVNVIDLNLAIEAARAKLPLVALERADGYIRPLASDQPDSIYIDLHRDDTRQTKLALQLQALRAEARP